MNFKNFDFKNINKEAVKKVAGFALAGAIGLGLGIGGTVGVQSIGKDTNIAAAMNNIGGLLLGNQEGSFMKLSMVRASAVSYADTYTVTATITPADATYKDVEFSVAWKNPNSSWASGKKVGDYVTITQANESALSATLTCKAAFAEQIVLTCQSKADTNIKATANIEYYKKVTLGRVRPVVVTEGENTFQFGITLSEGTKTGTYEVENAEFTLTDAVINAFGGRLSTYNLSPQSIALTAGNDRFEEGSYVYDLTSNITLGSLFSGYDSLSATNKKSFANMFMSICKAQSLDFAVTVDFKYTCGSEVSTKTYSAKSNFSDTAFATAVQGLSLNGAEFDFGGGIA